MLFSSTSDFPLCLCLLFFLWLTCFFSCLLNIPGYERTMRDSWPRILQTLKFISWFYSHGVIPQSIKQIRTYFHLHWEVEAGVIYLLHQFYTFHTPFFTIISPTLFARRHLHMERTINTAKSCKNPTAFPIPPGWIRLLCWHPSLRDTISLS